MAGKTKHGANRSSTKTNHLNNFLHGAASVLRIAPRREYHIPKRGDFARDAQALRGDFANVAGDMSYAVNKYMTEATEKYGAG